METFLVLYGDNLITADLGPLFAEHSRHDALATLALVEGPDPCAGGIVGIAADGRATRFVEKPRPHEVFSRLVNAGLYVMEPEVLRFIPENAACDFGRDVLPALVADGRPVFGWKLPGYVAGIDTPELYLKAQSDVEAGRFQHPLALEAGAGLNRTGQPLR